MASTSELKTVADLEAKQQELRKQAESLQAQARALEAQIKFRRNLLNTLSLNELYPTFIDKCKEKHNEKLIDVEKTIISKVGRKQKVSDEYNIAHNVGEVLFISHSTAELLEIAIAVLPDSNDSDSKRRLASIITDVIIRNSKNDVLMKISNGYQAERALSMCSTPRGSIEEPVREAKNVIEAAIKQMQTSERSTPEVIRQTPDLNPKSSWASQCNTPAGSPRGDAKTSTMQRQVIPAVTLSSSNTTEVKRYVTSYASLAAKITSPIASSTTSTPRASASSGPSRSPSSSPSSKQVNVNLSDIARNKKLYKNYLARKGKPVPASKVKTSGGFWCFPDNPPRIEKEDNFLHDCEPLPGFVMEDGTPVMIPVKWFTPKGYNYTYMAIRGSNVYHYLNTNYKWEHYWLDTKNVRHELSNQELYQYFSNPTAGGTPKYSIEKYTKTNRH